MANLSSRRYLSWRGVENVPPHEEDDIQAVADMINEMQKQAFVVHRHAFGGTHIRTQGLVKGTLEVLPDLPSHLRQGELFSQAGVYPACARYSTETSDGSIDDRIPQPRGFALKVFNVSGDMFDAGKARPTHDFEFNSTPAIELADAKTTKEIIALRMAHGHSKEELYKKLEQRDDTDLQKARDNVYNTHIEATTFYSQTAYRFGDYVFKYRMTPNTQTQKALHDEQPSDKHDSNVLAKWLERFHANHEAEYLFEVQLLENLDEQPVEYSGVPWDEEKFPWQTVAKIKFPKQDSFIYKRKVGRRLTRLRPDFLGRPYACRSMAWSQAIPASRLGKSITESRLSSKQQHEEEVEWPRGYVVR